MKPLPNTPEMRELATRLVWFRTPEEALSHPIELVTYALQYASTKDMHIIITAIGKDGLIEAIDHATPGVVSLRSWAYWNLVIGRTPTPPLPVRTFPR